MRNKLLIIFSGIIFVCHAQTGSKKLFPFSGTFTLNYEVKKVGNSSSVKGNIICAFDAANAAFIPSFANTMQDVVAAKLLANINYNELSMLTTMKGGKKIGLLTLVPKPVLEKSQKAPVITKTTMTKIIQSFPCQKIVVTLNDSTKIEAWITNSMVLPVNDAVQFSNLGFKNKSPFNTINITSLSTTSLETIVTTKNGDVTKFTVTDIKKVKPVAAFFSSDGYNIMDARALLMH